MVTMHKYQDYRARQELEAVAVARHAASSAQATLREAVEAAGGRGATESAIARASGLSRTTVRAWLGR